MITIITVDEQNQTFYARTLDATAASGDLVMPGKPTNKQIRELADNTLLAPESGTFAGFGVIKENDVATERNNIIHTEPHIYYPCAWCDGSGLIENETCSHCDGSGESRDDGQYSDRSRQ